MGDQATADTHAVWDVNVLLTMAPSETQYRLYYKQALISARWVLLNINIEIRKKKITCLLQIGTGTQIWVLNPAIQIITKLKNVMSFFFYQNKLFAKCWK